MYLSPLVSLGHARDAETEPRNEGLRLFSAKTLVIRWRLWTLWACPSDAVPMAMARSHGVLSGFLLIPESILW